MSKTTLEIMIMVDADDTTLHQLKAALVSADYKVTPLAKAVAQAVKAEFTKAGLADKAEVKLNESHVCLKAALEGGLNAEEWLEKEPHSEFRSVDKVFDSD